MNWVEEQINQRELNDEDDLRESLAGISDAVLGTYSKTSLLEASETSEDALEQILRYYDIPARPLPVSVTTLSEQLEYLLEPAGIMKRAVTLSDDWYRRSAFPLLARKKESGEWVALLPGTIYGYEFADSSSGTTERVTAGNESDFEREALTFYRSFPLKKIGIPELVTFVRQTLDKADIILLCVLGLVIAGLGLLLPYINELMTGVIAETGNVGLFAGVAVCLICITISRLLFSVIQSVASGRIQTKLTVAVEAATYIRVLSLPTTFFTNNNSGDLANRIGMVQSICSTITNVLLSSGLAALMILVYTPQLFMFSSALAVPAILVILSLSVFTIISSVIRLSYAKDLVVLNSKESGMSYALIRGIQKIKLAGAEKRSFSQWAKLYEKLLRVKYGLPAVARQSLAFSSIFSLLGVVVIYMLAVRNQVSVSTFYAFNTVYGMVLGAFMSLAQIAESVAAVKPKIDLLQSFFAAEPEISEDKIPVDKLKGRIELKNLSFSYDDNGPDVIGNLSLKIEPGEYLGIVGVSGCGKSTLMHIMLGFLKPKKGAVYYDNKDLSSLDVQSVRQNIGTVLQDGKLLRGDIYSNITLTAPYLTLDEAMEAAEIAGIADDIRHMPMGLLTLVSDGAGGLSGGQKQRILIARAIAPKPSILFFDEATSALDNITQKKVSDALDALSCTRVVIAHRLSTIRHCHRIVVLDKGSVAESGTYEELMEKEGLFYNLVRRQSGV